MTQQPQPQKKTSFLSQSDEEKQESKVQLKEKEGQK